MKRSAPVMLLLVSLLHSSTVRSLSLVTSRSASTEVMKSILYRVRQVNKRPPADLDVLSFCVDDEVLGKVTRTNAQRLIENGNVFLMDSSSDTLRLHNAGSTVESRSNAVATVFENMRDQGIIKGWRDELYSIQSDFYAPPKFLMERAAVPYLGALEYGVHVNGLVRQDDGSLLMWMARRSATKSKFPGMLDHIVAGGQPAGLSLGDNVVKECEEEAGIPKDLAQCNARSAGAISYQNYSKLTDTIQRAIVFNYDLHLPADFIPAPQDGEVEEFFLWSIDQLLESMAEDFHDPIKPNCYSVIIDFLLREGHLSPELPGYLDVLRELRCGDCR